MEVLSLKLRGELVYCFALSDFAINQLFNLNRCIMEINERIESPIFQTLLKNELIQLSRESKYWDNFGMEEKSINYIKQDIIDLIKRNLK